VPPGFPRVPDLFFPCLILEAKRPAPKTPLPPNPPPRSRDSPIFLFRAWLLSGMPGVGVTGFLSLGCAVSGGGGVGPRHFPPRTNFKMLPLEDTPLMGFPGPSFRRLFRPKLMIRRAYSLSLWSLFAFCFMYPPLFPQRLAGASASPPSS